MECVLDLVQAVAREDTHSPTRSIYTQEVCASDHAHVHV